GTLTMLRGLGRCGRPRIEDLGDAAAGYARPVERMRLTRTAEADDADAHYRGDTVNGMTVDNRGGLATLSADVNSNKTALLDAFLIPGRAVELGCGAGQYGDAIARRCGELLQIDLVDRRSPDRKSFPFLE